MNLADTPNIVVSEASARSNRRLPSGCTGEPSYNTNVASDASAVTSQFHIIQPHVEK